MKFNKLTLLENNNIKIRNTELTEMISLKFTVLDELLDALEDFSNNMVKYSEENEFFFTHNYIFALLANLRERKLFDVLVKFIKLPSDVLEKLPHEKIPQMLASVCKVSDLPTIYSLIEDTTIDPYIRGSLFDVLMILFIENVIKRSEIVDYLKDLYDNKIDLFNNSHSLIDLVETSTQLRSLELEKRYMKFKGDPQFNTYEHLFIRHLTADTASTKLQKMLSPMEYYRFLSDEGIEYIRGNLIASFGLCIDFASDEEHDEYLDL